MDPLACTYHASKFAIWGAVEGIIIAICVLGIREAGCSTGLHKFRSSVCMHNQRAQLARVMHLKHVSVWSDSRPAICMRRWSGRRLQQSE